MGEQVLEEVVPEANNGGVDNNVMIPAVAPSLAPDANASMAEGAADKGEEGVPVLSLCFLLPDGSSKTVKFENFKPPLGLTFSHTKPCKIKLVTPGGLGEKLGVQSGWVVTSVNEQAANEIEDPKGVALLVREFLQNLRT